MKDHCSKEYWVNKTTREFESDFFYSFKVLRREFLWGLNNTTRLLELNWGLVGAVRSGS